MAGQRKLVESTTGHILVGIFVLLATAGFGWLLISQGQGPAKYDLIAEFDVLGSINEATKVKLRGFTVGQVKHIEFRPQPPEGEAYFLVVLGIEKRYPVPVGVVAEIRSSGLVGESYIDLNVNSAGVVSLQPDSHVEGRSDPGLKGLMRKIGEAARKLGAAGEGIKKAALGGRLGRLTLDVSYIADVIGRVSAHRYAGGGYQRRCAAVASHPALDGGAARVRSGPRRHPGAGQARRDRRDPDQSARCFGRGTRAYRTPVEADDRTGQGRQS